MKKLLSLIFAFALLTLPIAASEPVAGNWAIGAGYGTASTADSFDEDRGDGYTYAYRYWMTDHQSIMVEASDLELGNLYTLSFVPAAGSVYFPLGVSYLDPADGDPSVFLGETSSLETTDPPPEATESLDIGEELGLHGGIGISLWAEKFVGLQFPVRSHLMADDIAGEDQFIDGTAMLLVRF
jgi:hypothetical protein